MVCLIFANGPALFLPPVLVGDRRDYLVIAVDGGSKHCDRLSLTPDFLIGDLDSIELKLLAEYRQKHVVIDQYPQRKDSTDLELALDLAQKKGAKEIEIFGALGGRWDMSLANFFLAAAPQYHSCRIRLHGDGWICYILHRGETNFISGRPGTRFSLLPLTTAVREVTISGSEYPLINQTLPFGSTWGVSNIMVESEISITFAEGILAAVVEGE